MNDDAAMLKYARCPRLMSSSIAFEMKISAEPKSVTHSCFFVGHLGEAADGKTRGRVNRGAFHARKDPRRCSPHPKSKDI
jgi:hypothetical protein